jgi:hypothetical protein
MAESLRWIAVILVVIVVAIAAEPCHNPTCDRCPGFKTWQAVVLAGWLLIPPFYFWAAKE